MDNSFSSCYFKNTSSNWESIKKFGIFVIKVCFFPPPPKKTAFYPNITVSEERKNTIIYRYESNLGYLSLGTVTLIERNFFDNGSLRLLQYYLLVWSVTSSVNHVFERCPQSFWNWKSYSVWLWLTDRFVTFVDSTNLLLCSKISCGLPWCCL